MPVSSQWFANPGVTYEIEQSIRFNDDDAAYLYRDNDSAQTDTKKFTYSLWIKRGAITGGTNTGLLSGGAGTTSGRSDFIFTAGSATGDSSNNDALKFDIYTGGWTQIRADAKLRDPAAWYHIVLVYDAANSTANDTLIMYVNNTRLTLDSTSGVPNNLSLVNANGQRTRVGADASGTPVEFDGYMAEINMIDGQALTPASFGETNSNTGQWVPKAYSGAYGNNGFFIDGRDSSDLGDDESGSNDFTSTGLAAADQITGDTPTTNACVMSPIDQYSNALTLADGNLHCTPSTSAYCSAHGTFYVSSGKWVIECKHTTVFGEGIGFAQNGQIISGSAHRGFGMFADGRKFVNTTYTATGVGLASGDYRYCFLDLDNNAMWFAHVDVSSSNALVYDNSATKAEIEAGTTTNAVHTSLPAGDYAPTVWMDTNGVIEMNFGQKDFITTSDLPSGFKKLNTANLDDPAVADSSSAFLTQLYAGNGSTQTITNGGNSDLQPDLVWIKNRSAADSHVLTDSVRGATKILATDSTGAESTDADTVTAFASDGFALGDDDKVNTSSENYVAWQWKADSAWSEDATGNIVASSGWRNTTAGFSIASWTHQTSGNYAIRHGLSTTPEFFMTKSRDNTVNWDCWHKDLADTAKRLLMTTAAESTAYWVDASDSSDGSGSYGDISSGESPVTASLFGFQHDNFSATDDVVGYFWHGVEFFSKFGSYTGTGSATTSGSPFIYTGFKPAFLMYKVISTTDSWEMYDDARQGFNVHGTQLKANLSNAETDDTRVDILSNGFKPRSTNTAVNAAQSYIFAAWAESPFKTATAR